MNLCLKAELEGMFANESARIRKKIRLLDLELVNDGCPQKKNLNFLILGPSQSGKRSLLKTLNHSLNALSRCQTEQKTQNGITYEKYNLKKGNKVKVEGLSVLRQTSRKISISGFRLKQNNLRTTNEFLRGLPNDQAKGQRINLVIICISAENLLANQDILWIEDVIKTLTEIKMEFMVVGTKIDKILADQIQELVEDKSVSIGNWRDYIKNLTGIRNNKDIFCLENYRINDSDRKNSEEINFYAMALLDRCLDKIQQKKTHEHFFNFKCFGWL